MNRLGAIHAIDKPVIVLAKWCLYVLVLPKSEQVLAGTGLLKIKKNVIVDQSQHVRIHAADLLFVR